MKTLDQCTEICGQLDTAHAHLNVELQRIDSEIAIARAQYIRHKPKDAIESAMALLSGEQAIPERNERLEELLRRRQVIAKGFDELTVNRMAAVDDRDRAAMRDREPQVLQAMAAIEAGLDVLIAGCDQLKNIRDEATRAGIACERSRLPVSADTDIREWVAIWRRKFNESHAQYAQLTAPPQEPQQTKRKSVVAALKEALTVNPEAGELVGN